MKHCLLCDREGPLEVGEFIYAWIDLHRALHRLGRELMKPFERLINWIETKLTRKPVYEPAGIIHYGEWHFGDYYAQATPHGSYHVWEHDEYLGEYKGQRIEIVEHLHAKGKK